MDSNPSWLVVPDVEGIVSIKQDQYILLTDWKNWNVIKFNKLWFSLEQLDYLPYCHCLESSQLQNLKNWEKSIIIDTPVINPCCDVDVRKCRLFLQIISITYFFCREGQSKAGTRELGETLISAWCWDHLCLRILTSSYSISKERKHLFALYRKLASQNIMCRRVCNGSV